MTTPFPRTVALLEELGIDPNIVIAESISEGGYKVFLLDEDGKRVLNGMGEHAEWEREQHWWPTEIGQMVLRTMVKDTLEATHGSAVGQPHSIDRVVLLRRTYDMYETEIAKKEWLEAEAELSPRERELYQALYQRVSETTPKTESE